MEKTNPSRLISGRFEGIFVSSGSGGTASSETDPLSLTAGALSSPSSVTAVCAHPASRRQHSRKAQIFFMGQYSFPFHMVNRIMRGKRCISEGLVFQNYYTTLCNSLQSPTMRKNTAPVNKPRLRRIRHTRRMLLLLTLPVPARRCREQLYSPGSSAILCISSVISFRKSCLNSA